MGATDLYQLSANPDVLPSFPYATWCDIALIPMIVCSAQTTKAFTMSLGDAGGARRLTATSV